MSYNPVVRILAKVNPQSFLPLGYLRVRRTTLIAVGCASFLLGLGAVQLGGVLYGAIWPLLALCLLPLCLKKKAIIAVPVVTAIGLIGGMWRGGLTLVALSQYQPYFEQKVSLQGVVVEDPTYDDRGQLDFRLQSVTIDGQNMAGQVRVKTLAAIDVKRGDAVQAQGKLVDGFGNYQAAIYYAAAQTITKNQNFIDTLRREFAASVLTAMPEPQASLGLGFLVGLKSGLPGNLSEQLKILGLTHIVVASGYNLTILVRLARRIFEKRSKYQTAAVSVGLMAGFVAVTGFSPSMSRAALVTGLAVWAWYYGRHIHPVVLLLVAAGITAAINPLYAWSDLGWWLSFLAFAGVLVLAPLLQRRLFGDTRPKFIGQIVLETICAQLLTLPLILFVFGDFSVLALLANVLIVPLVPLAMLLTFAGGVVGLVAPVLAAVVSLPAVWLLGFMTEVVRLLAQISWASVPFTIAWPVMLGCYSALIAVAIVLWRKTKLNFWRTSIVD